MTTPQVIDVTDIGKSTTYNLMGDLLATLGIDQEYVVDYIVCANFNADTLSITLVRADLDNKGCLHHDKENNCVKTNTEIYEVR